MVSPMIFFISLAVLKLTTYVPKIADFLSSCLGYWQVFSTCQYFPSSWGWAEQTIIFSISSSVICNKPALANVKSFSDTLSLERWCLIRCPLISALHTLKGTKSVHPNYFHICLLKCMKMNTVRPFFKANNANLLHKNFQLSPSQCQHVEYKICILHYLKLVQLKEKKTSTQKAK